MAKPRCYIVLVIKFYEARVIPVELRIKRRALQVTSRLQDLSDEHCGQKQILPGMNLALLY